MAERALVTGASGFIGTAVLDKLGKSGLDLHALSRSHEPGQDADAHWWRGDIADPDVVAKVFASAQPDLVFNIAGDTHAARDLHLVRPTFEANLAGTVNADHRGHG